MTEPRDNEERTMTRTDRAVLTATIAALALTTLALVNFNEQVWGGEWLRMFRYWLAGA